jgi:hypothetical protein
MMQSGAQVVPFNFFISFSVSSQVEGIIALFGLMFRNQYHILHSTNNNSLNVLIGCIADVEVNAGRKRKGNAKELNQVEWNVLTAQFSFLSILFSSVHGSKLYQSIANIHV